VIRRREEVAGEAAGGSSQQLITPCSKQPVPQEACVSRDDVSGSILAAVLPRLALWPAAEAAICLVHCPGGLQCSLCSTQQDVVNIRQGVFDRNASVAALRGLPEVPARAAPQLFALRFSLHSRLPQSALAALRRSLFSMRRASQDSASYKQQV
jgi:hypothetical protein